ncbi:MAG: hypothetical protein SFX72_20105 [Isosphaeraceae bacterium]|nr:hypothetical protein [Isosphaeraceae bacterium]
MTSKLDRLRRAAYGLGLVSIGLAISVVLLIVMLAVGLPKADRLRVEGLEALGPWNYVINFLGLLSAAVSLVGKFFCARVPEESAATGPITLSLFFGAAGLLFSVGSEIPATAALFQNGAPFTPLFSALGYVTFLVYMRRVSDFVGEPLLAEHSRRVLMGSLLLVPPAFLGLILISEGGAGLGVIVGVAALVGVVIAGWVLFFLFARLIHRLRRAIDIKASLYEDLGD